jgi:hypothetical protein
MLARRTLLFALAVTATLCGYQMAAAQEAVPAEAPQPRRELSDDPTVIYRYDPIFTDLVEVPPAEIKPGCVYLRHHPELNRRVWSLALPGGGFEYAMAPGSVQPAQALDLRATPEQLESELMARAPELARVLDVRGGIAHVRLAEDDTWHIVKQPTISSVFDLATSRRWEWHGARRVPIVHTGGYDWLLVDGKYVPGSYPVAAWSTGGGGGCCW